MKRHLTHLLILLLLIIPATAMAAAPPGGQYFWPAAVDVSIFKNSCAYIIREGETETTAEGVLTATVPRAVLGTLDVYALTEGVKVGEVVAFYDQTSRTVPIDNLEDFYRQQIGHQLQIEFAGGKVEGTLRAVLTPGNLLVETSDATVLVPISSITRLTLPSGASMDRTEKTAQPRFRIILNNAPRKVKLSLSYLEESWSWYPSYRLNLLGGDKAELVLSATVVNDAEDVTGAKLHLVVGVPTFIMRGTLSPMALDVDSGQLRSYAPAAPSQMFDNALRSAVSAEAVAETSSAAVPVGAVEDMFVYEKKGFTLGKGQRMQFELFRGEVPCGAFYKWELPLGNTSSYSGNYLQNTGKFSGEQTGEIWHYLRLGNKTIVPWTTGPAMIVSGWQPVAQNQMKYVPVGGTYDMPVTVAPDLKGTAREEEAGRKTVKIGGSDYLQVTVRGTIELESFKTAPAQMEITKDLWGTVKEAGGATVTKRPELLWNVNPHSQLTWKLTMPAKDGKTLTYTYDLYVRI